MPTRSLQRGIPLQRISALAALSIVVALAASLAALAFVESIGWINQALLISPRIRVQHEHNPAVLIAATLLVPTLGGIAVGLLLEKLSSAQRPLGPVDVIRSAQMRTPLPDLRSGIISTVASVLSIGSGASVGQYGPLVYLGAMAGQAASAFRIGGGSAPAIAAACGVAAAISTAFNAPIAGLIFAHEVILRHYSLRAFALTTVASATGYFVANVMFDRPALFLVRFPGVQHGHEFALFALLGILSAAIAVTFIKLILASAAAAGRIRVHRALRTGFAGLAVGVTALWLPDVLGVGTEALRFATIEGAFSPIELMILVTAKICLTALCIGFGFAGGVFSPSLLIGILFGALFWNSLELLQLAPTSGIVAYAICGMMAVASPVMGAPLTVILIVFELTRNYDLTIAAMVSVVFSNLIAFRFVGRSLFDLQLLQQGIDLTSGRDSARLGAAKVGQFAIGHLPPAYCNEPASDVLLKLGFERWNEIFIQDDEGHLLGKALRSDLIANGGLRMSELCRPVETVFNETTTILEAMNSLEDFIGDAIPLVSSETGNLMGVVTEAAIIKAYLQLVEDIRSEENAPV